MEQSNVQAKVYEVMPGVSLTVLPTDRFKVGMLSLSFVLPFSKDDAAARSLLLSVLRRGCETYPTIAEINRRLDDLYATPFRVIDSTRGGCQYIGFGAELLDDKYIPESMDLCTEVLSLIRDMLFHPLTERQGLLCERYVEQEKKNAIDLLHSLQNEPSSYAYARFLDVFRVEGTPNLPVLDGAEDRISALTTEGLTKAWQDLLRRAPMECFYIGGMDPERLVARLRAVLLPAFETIDRVFVPAPAACYPSASWGEVQKVEEQGDGGQSHLILGFRSGVTLQSPDYFAMMLCNELLGQSPISRLFVHVREAHSLCYSCSSRYRMMYGELTIACGISAENKERATTAILEQIEVLKRGDFSETEWLAARKSLIGGVRQLEDSTRGLSNFYKIRLPLCPDHSIDEYIERFEALTREDVMAAAERLKLDLIYFRRGNGGEGEEDDADD